MNLEERTISFDHVITKLIVELERKHDAVFPRLNKLYMNTIGGLSCCLIGMNFLYNITLANDLFENAPHLLYLINYINIIFPFLILISIQALWCQKRCEDGYSCKRLTDLIDEITTISGDQSALSSDQSALSSDQTTSSD